MAGGRRVQPRRAHQPEQGPSRCIQYTLIILNMLFWLLSILIIAIGAYIIVESKDHFKNMADLKFQPSIFILIAGGIIFIITFIGCIGAVRENTTLLRLYIGIILAIILIVIACAVLAFVFRDKLETTISKKVKSIIPVYRAAGDKYLDLQNIIDAVQTDWECCGAESYQDWEANVYFNCSAPLGSSRRCGVPFSCCKKDLQENRQCGFGARDPKLKGLQKINALKAINTFGCVQQGTVWLTNNWALLGGIAIGILVLQLVSVFLASRLSDQIREIRDRRG
ncbi:tetraspanin-33 [Exaiptasia diaphana]|uniref:Tetraspanin n=1 Tax=Exaiptasia diaphana TaxID=2652724 RepID=A0A913WTZ9_EXADI|nr:tetraspanin-33 [Exaiptasia diaphana]XP_020894061.1 tetraspanin-33 [Exaiptasia diaphana]KXJ17895.1 Tetraspanin-5 [Exaiptasia diaphana]